MVGRTREMLARTARQLEARVPIASAPIRRLREFRRNNILRSDRVLRHRYRHSMRAMEGGLELEYDPTQARIHEIEINKNCNLDCVMCNTALSERPNFNMALHLFEDTVRTARDLDPQGLLALHTIGEPLVNPLLPEYLAILRRYGMRIRLSTNALRLKEKLPIIFEHADVIAILRFSIDGACQETYEKIRRPGKFSRLMENMEAFHEEHTKRPCLDRLEMDSIVSSDVQHELAHHLDFYSKYVPMENIFLHLVNGLSPDNTYFFEKSVLKNYIIPNIPCSQLAGSMHVLNDGRVSVCCRDYQGDLVIGNIKESSPKELWNGPIMRELRRQHIEDDIPSDSLCADCFAVDYRVADLFELFTTALVQRNSRRWTVSAMQRRFDEFFEIFATEIPNEERFVELLN